MKDDGDFSLKSAKLMNSSSTPPIASSLASYPRLKKNSSVRFSTTSISSSTNEVLLESPDKVREDPISSSVRQQQPNLKKKMMASSFFRKPYFSFSGSSPFSSTDRDSFDSDHSCPSAFAPVSRANNPVARRGRFPSRDSTDSSTTSSSNGELSAGKSNYRILLLGAKRTGKTAIIRQFLYDQFTPAYMETVDDMYRGEFEIHNQKVTFDIQDVSGGYVYEFPVMRNVSLSSADAFIIVFTLDDANTWDEVSRLRDMIHLVKDPDIPIVIVGNKSDLSGDKNIPNEALEAIVTFDWENGYVESSAKESRNINKIFKELLQQAKSKYDFTIPQLVSASALVNSSNGSSSVSNQREETSLEDHMKRRQSLPLVPAGWIGTSTSSHGPSNGHKASHHATKGEKEKKRRSSLAVLRRDSCKIS